MPVVCCLEALGEYIGSIKGSQLISLALQVDVFYWISTDYQPDFFMEVLSVGNAFIYNQTNYTTFEYYIIIIIIPQMEQSPLSEFSWWFTG